MNIRQGIKRSVIVATALIDGAVILWVLANPTYPRNDDDWLAIVAFGIGIPLIAFVGWLAANWIVRGFQNSN